MKKWLFLFFLSIPWFLFVLINTSSLSIEMPIKIPNILFYSLTTLTILCTVYSVSTLHQEYSFKETKEYNRYLLVYYLFFQGIFLSLFMNIFISFSCSIIALLASLFLYYESKSYDKNISKYLWPSIYYNLVISCLLLITYFMNL